MVKCILQKIAYKYNRNTIIPVVQNIPKDKFLDGKVALVIGGAGDIGGTIVDTFIGSGCKVVIASRSESELKRKAAKYSENQVGYICVNLEEPYTFDYFVQCVKDIFGKIDILVNAAGTHTPDVDFWTVSEDEYDRVLGINLKGCYFMCKAVAKYMCTNRIEGHILNISSSVATEPAWSPYRISKRGVEGITIGLAKILLPYKIIVNSIAPGTVATKLNGFSIKNGEINTDTNEVGRMVLPQEIANYALLLVSDLGNMIIGDTLYISGGRGVFDIR
ncbi:SDR family NAD(P)-dependent oxidoreductase [Phocaeicola sp.]